MVDYLSPAWLDAIRAGLAGVAELPALAAAHPMGFTQHVTVPGAEPVVYHLSTHTGTASADWGPADPEDARFVTDRDTAVEVATGALNAQQAFLTGRLTVRGDQQRLVTCLPLLVALDGVMRRVGAHTRYPAHACFPEVQAHAERLTERYAGAVLERFVPLRFTALKTATPPPDLAQGRPLVGVGRRGKYLLADFGELTFIVHLMQGGRLKEDPKPASTPKQGQARWHFADGRAWLLTEAGSERRAGVWCALTADALDNPPLSKLGPEADGISAEVLAERFAARPMRLHTFLRDQGCIAGLGRRLANEVCHRARLSPFASTAKLGAVGAAAVAVAIDACLAEGLAYERTRPDMSSSADRPGGVHRRSGEPCPVCGATVREVAYSSYTVNYCPTCQTGGKVLADNTTSKFLR